MLNSNVYVCGGSGGGQNHYEKVKREVTEKQEMEGGIKGTQVLSNTNYADFYSSEVKKLQPVNH